MGGWDRAVARLRDWGRGLYAALSEREKEEALRAPSLRSPQDRVSRAVEAKPSGAALEKTASRHLPIELEEALGEKETHKADVLTTGEVQDTVTA